MAREHDLHVLALVSQAKAELGLWSELGVDEGRRLFWRSFEAGKVRLLSGNQAMHVAARGSTLPCA